MGIRFACHHCNHAMHVKDFQAGKRGRCPACKEAFRIPMADATHSLEIDQRQDEAIEPADDFLFHPSEGSAAPLVESLVSPSPSSNLAALLKEQRKAKEKKTQLIIIIILSIVSFALLCGLIAVLAFNQSGGAAQP